MKDDLARYLAFSEQIPGWTRGKEAIALANAASALNGDAVIVEIGSFLGSSAVILAGARKLKGSGRVHCVDPFDGSGDDFSTPHYSAILMALSGHTPREHFERYIRMAGVYKRVVTHQGTAAEIAATWTIPIDMLFLDGDQTPAGARIAYEAWAPWLKVGGTIAIHNSSEREIDPEEDHHGQYLVAKTEIKRPQYTKRRVVSSLTFAQKAK